MTPSHSSSFWRSFSGSVLTGAVLAMASASALAQTQSAASPSSVGGRAEGAAGELAQPLSAQPVASFASVHSDSAQNPSWTPTLPHPGLTDANGNEPGSTWKRSTFALANAGSTIKQRTVHAAEEGSWDLYVPFYSYHPAWVYSAPARERFHDDAWGLGFGKHWTDDRGNQDLVYGMVFTESHGHAEPIVGYARIWNTDPIWGQIKLGAGYTVGVTSRPDILSGVPFPLALPLVSAQVGRFSVMSSIVPDTKGVRVALFWARIEMGSGAL